MKTHRLRVQVQQARNNIASKGYEENCPCSKNDAARLLDSLETAAKGFSKKREWQETVAEEIKRAKEWVSRSPRQDAPGNGRTIYSHPFKYDGYEFRVDIEINGGDRHFT